MSKVEQFMRSKIWIGILIPVVIVAGLLIGVGTNFLGGRGKSITQKEKADRKDVAITGKPAIETERTNEIQPPSPTFPPLSRKVKSISEKSIIVTGEEGDMTVPQNPDMVKVYQRIDGELKEAGFDEVEVGQSVTIEIIIPGKEARLIIEE